MVDINNIDTYNNEMQKSMDDKLFFKKYLSSIDNIVDFGCADGMLLSLINSSVNKYGIDINEEMIELARKRVPEAQFEIGSNPCIGSNFDYNKSALILSSVLHEIYSYYSDDKIKGFWAKINSCNYKYIFIRDMICNLTDENSDLEDVFKIYNKNNELGNKIEDFEITWGKILKQRNLFHFLLKYRYTLNWEREVKEDYIQLTSDKIIDNLKNKYEVIAIEEYTLPFIHDQVKRDFDIDFKDKTHVKIVLKLK